MKNLLRNLAYASVIIAALTVTLHQFNQPAEAQGSGTIAATNFYPDQNPCAVGLVTLTNGDVYHVVLAATTGCYGPDHTTYIGNIWSGGPINSESSTWGAVKSRFGEK